MTGEAGAIQVLRNGVVHTPAGPRHGLAVVVEGAAIAAVLPEAEAPTGGFVQDLAGGHLAAGFIDLQVNGGGGVLFTTQPEPEALTRIAAAHRRHGVTGFLPTVISAPARLRQQARSAVMAAAKAGLPGLLGIHWEGPHLNPARRGVHPAAVLGPPDADDLALLAPLASSPRTTTPLAVLATLAPETLSADVRRRLLAIPHLILAVGHSDADYAAASSAFAQGFQAVTHLFNAMRPWGHREPGLIGAALETPAVFCGLIADGHHVHPAALRLARRCKGWERLFLVSDAMPPAGTACLAPDVPNPAASRFSLFDAPVTVENGACRTATGQLAGSALTLDAAVRNAVTLMEVSLTEALAMAAAVPADLLGQTARRGRIRPGLAADLVWLDATLQVQATWIAGQR